MMWQDIIDDAKEDNRQVMIKLLRDMLSPLDRIRIDGQFHGQAPHRWQLAVFLQRPCQHQLLEPGNHLFIDRTSVPIIQYDHKVPPFLNPTPQPFSMFSV